MLMKLPNLVRRVANRWIGAPYPGHVATLVPWIESLPVRMGLDDALRLSTVWACTTVIAKALASSHWDVFYSDANGDRHPRRGTIAYRLLNIRPNPLMTPIAFREAMLMQAILLGDSFAEIERDNAGRPLSLWPIAPMAAGLEYGNGSLTLVVSVSGGGQVRIPYEDVYHLRGPGLTGLTGYGTLNAALQTFAAAGATEKFGNAFYANGASPSLVATAKQPVPPERVKELREAIEARGSGLKNAFRPLVLGADFDVKQATVNPNDGQFIETRQFLVEEVCRFFGVPPHKVQHLLRATFNNIEQLGIEFARDALVPWAERLRQEADFKLLTASGSLRSWIDIEWQSEGDTKTKIEAAAQLVQNGIASRNEVRRKLGLNSAGAKADGLTVQSQNVPLETVDATPAQPPANDLPAANAAPVFDMTWRRIQSRQLHRAEEAARTTSHTDDFVAKVEAAQPDHRAYAVTQLHETADALGVELDGAALGELVDKVLADDMRLIGEGYVRGDVGLNWDVGNRPLGEMTAELLESKG